MVAPPAPTTSRSAPASSALWESGLFLMGCNFLVAIGNYLFQALIGRKLALAEYGFANAAASAVLLLSLPVTATSNALVHYIARFVAADRHAELQGLVASVRKWLAIIAGIGFVLALVAVRPLTEYFDFPRTTLVQVMALNMAAVLATVFVTALCTGMGWYARLGCIAVAAVAVRLILVWLATMKWASAESAIAATATASLVYAVVLFWRKHFTRRGERINPWNRDLTFFALAALVSAIASYAFTQSDVLMAQRNFPPDQLARFCAAGVFSRALLGLGAPLLTVFFATRSAANERHGAMRTYVTLLGFYLLVMLAGGLTIVCGRDLLVRALFGHADPATSALMGRFALLMILIGVIEIIANWALAARIWSVVYLHALLAVGYVGCGLHSGRSPAGLLLILTIMAGASAVVLLLWWQRQAVRSRKIERAPADLPEAWPAPISP